MNEISGTNPDRPENRTQANRVKSAIRRLIQKVTPPILLDFLRKTHRSGAPATQELAAQLFRDSDLNVAADEYLSWLCGTVVAGFLRYTDGNLRGFDHAVRKMPSGGAMVEIGAYLGLSTNILAYLAIKYRRDNQFFTCDPWVFENTDKAVGGYFDASSAGFRNYVMEVFRKNAALFSPGREPFAVEAPSWKFFELWEHDAEVSDVFGRTVRLGGPISFAYVDGAHSYNVARADFIAVDKHLLPGGFILFDDSAEGWGFPEVTRVAEEVSCSGSYELVFKSPHFFFQKMSPPHEQTSQVF